MSENIIDINYKEELEESYLDYAMSVIVSRALPSVRDGLKPVQRRVIYAMGELGLSPNKPHKKSARIVGDVLGKYHPHGDSSVYEAMVRLAQDFSTRYPLVDGHGNFGSIDGDGAAAMRYTEVRMTEMGKEMLKDIHKNTVPFTDNFDNSLKEPSYLPTLIPFSLLSGISGIAVGMATNMPPYNINNVYNALNEIISKNISQEPIDQDLVLEKLGLPDFPTGGVIVNYNEAKEAVRTGRGRVVLRCKHHLEGDNIIITEIPYQVNKAKLISSINDLREELTDIKTVRDESSKDIRIVIELKKKAQINLVLNTLFKKTNLQSSFSINNTILVDNKPECLETYYLLEYFLAHSKEVIINRTNFDLTNSKDKEHLLEGSLIALENIEEVIKIIRESEDNKDSLEKLMNGLNLSERQAKSIQATQLGSLSRSSKASIEDELKKTREAIKLYQAILADEEILLKVIQAEYKILQEKLGDEVRTSIDYKADPSIDIEDLIEDEVLVVTYTKEGILNCIEEKEFNVQNRGGKGSRIKIPDGDILDSIYTIRSLDDLLCITNFGQCYKLKGYDLDKSSRKSRGKYIGNYLSLEEGERVLRIIPINLKEKKDDSLVLVTELGMIKRIKVEDLGIRNARIITFKEGDSLVDCYPVNSEGEKIMILSDDGYSILIDVNDVRCTGRTSMGVKGINLIGEDKVNSSVMVKDNDMLLTVSEKGFGKMTNTLENFNVQNRGGKGVRYYKITDKTSKIVESITIEEGNEVLLTTEKGSAIRIHYDDISVSGRATSGSKMINVKEDDKVIAVTPIIDEEKDLEEELEEV